jgi:cell division protein FtsI (penicillin-binding protein 3)
MRRLAKPVKKMKRRDPRQVAFTRFMLIVAIFVLWIGGISARLVHLQVKQHEFLAEKASQQRREVKRSKMPRGTIYDRNGRVLAMSVKVKTLYADATEIGDLKTSAKKLYKVLGVNDSNLLKQLTSAKDDERRFLPLAKGLDEASVQKINKALETPNIVKGTYPKSEGLYWREDQRRSYPNGSLAAHVIGFSNADGVGQAGIEQSQNGKLYGAVIKTTQERDRLGRVYDETISEQEPPSDVYLTIDIAVQFKTEQALERAVRSTNAKSGTAIVIDHKTGDILALANYPTFDPNRFSGVNAENLKNGAVQNIYSPGSVFKLITYGSALEKHLITPEGEIDPGNGTIEIAKHKFRDSHAVGRVTYAKALAQSSNVCAIKTSMRVGREDFYGLVKNMGFGKPTGVELPAETGGLVRPIERWNGDSLASMSIGYEIGVSALQMATAFATIANDGVRIQPHIIKEIRQSDEASVEQPQPEQRQVVGLDTARDLKKMLREVVLSGTGKRAQLEGYTSAGKTGTAWKFDPVLKRVNSAKYISSFIGFAPADNPAVTIAVVMDEPKSGARDGGQVAAPVFREVAEGILPELGVAQDTDQKPVFDAPEPTAEEVPDTLGQLSEDAEASSGQMAAKEKRSLTLPGVSRPANVEKKGADRNVRGRLLAPTAIRPRTDKQFLAKGPKGKT